MDVEAKIDDGVGPEENKQFLAWQLSGNRPLRFPWKMES
jgi:hypothetical protein